MTWALLLALAASASPAPKPKPWTVEMCTVRQPVASQGYIRFCIAKSPNKSPHCPLAGHDPREAMWAAQASSRDEAYFEILDCSWHSGQNPRDSLRRATK